MSKEKKKEEQKKTSNATAITVDQFVAEDKKPVTTGFASWIKDHEIYVVPLKSIRESHVTKRNLATSLIFLILLFGYSNNCFALDSETGSSMLANCERAFTPLTVTAGSEAMADEYAKRILCIGFLEASFKTVITLQTLRNDSKPFICPPTSGLTSGQLVRIAVKWLNDNPERLHEPSARLIIEAWIKAFPCVSK